MEASIFEWLNLVVRWVHIIAAISWIGSSFYFMWLDSSLEPAPKTDPNLAGSLWMVHSGGFYRVEKRYLAAGQVPENLHWFKWEAAITWLSGVSLLILVYYMGGLTADSSISPLLSLGLLAATWILYDLLWVSPLAEMTGFVSTLSFAGLVLATYGLCQVFGGRAAYLHVGAMLGTLMVANVWMRILPAQRQMIAATQAGKPRDMRLAERAKRRSVHNNYMTFPVIFIMVSNHFPSTYGHSLNWLVLAVLMLASAGVRHHMNVGSRKTLWLVVAAGIAIGSLCYYTSLSS